MTTKFIRYALMLLSAGLMSGCSVDAASNASNTIFTGNASAGAPVAGGMLVVTDSSTPARTFSAPVSADGSYRINVAGGIAPFLFHARGHVGSRQFEFFAASAADSGRVNISPLTSLVVANAAGQDCAVTACSPSTFTAVRLTGAGMKVQTQLAPLLAQFALAIDDAQDSSQNNVARARKAVSFKHIAVGGYVYSRDGPLEFVKDHVTGNWRMAGKQRATAVAKAGKDVSMYVPPPGASSFGKWLPFSTDSSIYPEGAILVVVSGSSISPAVTLVYSGGGNGTTRVAGTAMVEAVAGMSFLPACPRPAGQPGDCVNVAQAIGGAYTAEFIGPAAAPAGQYKNEILQTRALDASRAVVSCLGFSGCADRTPAGSGRCL